MDQKTAVLSLHMKGMELGDVKSNLMGYRAETLSAFKSFESLRG
jgi:hypothetical protein